MIVRKDTLIEKVATGTDGKAGYTADLPVNNSYYIKELQAPQMYVLNTSDVYSFAFNYAKENNRKKVTGVHKANIMKLSDGLFLNTFKEIASKYPDIISDDLIVDAACMNLVINPQKYDVMVMPNLYGDIISDLCSGLVGGLGMIPGANIGKDYAVFEAVHGSAPDIAGKNIANPTAIIQSSVMMLRYIGEQQAAQKIEDALVKVFEKGENLTCDLGGSATTDEFTNEILKYIK